MKIVINDCYGGFSLSPKAVRRLAELDGRECYFFSGIAPDGSRQYDKNFPIAEEKITSMFWSAYDIPNPDEVIGKSFIGEDGTYKVYNALNNKYSLTCRPTERTDPKLIQVVEELGPDRKTGASGSCAELIVVEIPDGIEWEITEYDGIETVEEVHRSWR